MSDTPAASDLYGDNQANQAAVDAGLLVAATKPSIGIDGAAAALHRQQSGAAGTLYPHGTALSPSNPGEHIVIRYGFLDAPNQPYSPDGDIVTSFHALGAAEMAMVDKAAQVWNAYANVTFVRDNPGGYVNGILGLDNLYFGGYDTGNDNVAAFETGLPHHDDIAGFSQDIWVHLGLRDYAPGQLSYGGAGFGHMLHEMGHFLGLQHPGDYNADDSTPINYPDSATFQEDNKAVTIMSYFGETFGGADYNRLSSRTPLIADIIAMNETIPATIDGPLLYGETYGFNGTYAPMKLSLPSEQFAGAIYDGGFVTLDYSLYTQAASFDLGQVYQSVGGLIHNLQLVGTDVGKLYSGSGDDTIIGDLNAQLLDGGFVNDSIVGGGALFHESVFHPFGGDTLEGWSGKDTLIGGKQADLIEGGIDDDELHGGGGHDTLDGGGGNDKLYAEDGSVYAETMIGGSGDDTFYDSDTDAAKNLMQGGSGNDIFYEFGGADTIEGGTGIDLISFSLLPIVPGHPGILLNLANRAANINIDPGLEWRTLHDALGNLLAVPVDEIEGFIGTTGDDTMIGASIAMEFFGGAGYDHLIGSAGNDWLQGDGGADTLEGGSGSDTLLGGDDNDSLDGGLGTEGDTLLGGLGHDTIMAPTAGLAAADTEVADGNPHPFDLLDLAFIPLADPLVTRIDVKLDENLLVLHGDSFDRNVGAVGFQWVSGSSLGEHYFVTTTFGLQRIEAKGGDDTVTIHDAGSTLDGGEGRDRIDVVLDKNAIGAELDLSTGTFSYNGVSGTAINFEDASLSAKTLTLTGTDEANVLVANGTHPGGVLVVHALGGDDRIELTGKGHATVDAGSGNDTVVGFALDSFASQTLLGGDGEDLLDLSAGGVIANITVDLAANKAEYDLPFTGSFAQISSFESVIGLQSAGGHNNLLGTEGANTLTGGGGGDSIDGRGGDDTLYGHGGADSLFGGGGDDLVVVGSAPLLGGEAHGGDGADILSLPDVTDPAAASFTFADAGGAGSFAGLSYDGFEQVNFTLQHAVSTNAMLTGGALADTLQGALGNDTLTGGGGDDELRGAEGNDTFILRGGDGNDSIDGGDGVDTVVFQLSDQNGGLTIDLSGPGFGGGFDGGVPGPTPVLVSVEGTRFELGGGNDHVIGSDAADTILGGGGDDTLDGAAGSDNLDGGTGNDFLTDQYAAGADTLLGGTGNDTLVAGSGADSLDGGGDDDLLQNFAFFYPGFTNPDNERDTMLGGAGNDTVQSFTPGIFDGGEGKDALIYSLSNAADGVKLDLSDPGVTVALPFGATVTGFEIFNLSLTNRDDYLVVNYAPHHLQGGYGNDELVIVVAAGQLFSPPVTITDPFAPPGEGDTMTFANGMTVSGFSNVVYRLKDNKPTGGDDLVQGAPGGGPIKGLGGNDTLLGQGGNDLLDGGTGADSMVGGKGNDTYVVDNIGDIVVEKPNEGKDTVKTTLLAYTLPDQVENLASTGLGDFTGTGNGLSNQLTSGAGNDTLFGQGGDDTLDGAAGADSMVGGQGNDTYLVDNAGDIVVEAANGGFDLVKTTLADYGLTNQVERLTYVGASFFVGLGNELDNTLTGGAGNDALTGYGGADSLVGGAGNDTLRGNEGNDTLDGGLGADKMIGGLNDDLYIVDDAGDVIVEEFSQGNDRVQTTLTTYVLPTNVERLTYSGNANFTGTGNGLDNIIYGNGGSDTLFGGDGNDQLGGEGGADELHGGKGDDTYMVDNAGDVVIENANEGNDTVKTTLQNYALTADVEKLVFQGAGDFTGIGNLRNNAITGGAGDDTLIGNGGDDTLDGGLGADSMVGGSGNDSYVVNNGGDQVLELPGEGIDVVRTILNNYTLSANVEKLIFTGGGSFTGIGNDGDNSIVGGDLADQLFGGAGNDTLDGGLGADQMNGGTGNDNYTVDNAGDVVVELANEGTDKVTASVSVMLAANVENLVLTGAGNLTGTGNALANSITGNTGDNLLLGGDGADTISGGSGDDTLVGGNDADKLYGGAGADTFRFNAASEGNDHIIDFVHGVDVLAFSAAGFGGGINNGMDLAAAQRFVLGGAANLAQGQFLFTAATGKLYWDDDGTGVDAKMLVATLAGFPSLTASDLMVIA